jgi:hypothetical protein
MKEPMGGNFRRPDERTLPFLQGYWQLTRQTLQHAHATKTDAACPWRFSFHEQIESKIKHFENLNRESRNAP